MVIQTLSKIEFWDNSRCSTSGLTSCKKNIIWYLIYLCVMDSLEPSPLEWCDSQTIQWSKSTLVISGCIPNSPEEHHFSGDHLLEQRPQIQGPRYHGRIWPSENVSFINSSYLSPQKKTKYPNIILISWYPWVVSCTHPDSKAMSGSGSGCGVRSAIALPAWESQETSLVETTFKP